MSLRFWGVLPYWFLILTSFIVTIVMYCYLYIVLFFFGIWIEFEFELRLSFWLSVSSSFLTLPFSLERVCIQTRWAPIGTRAAIHTVLQSHRVVGFISVLMFSVNTQDLLFAGRCSRPRDTVATQWAPPPSWRAPAASVRVEVTITTRWKARDGMSHGTACSAEKYSGTREAESLGGQWQLVKNEKVVSKCTHSFIFLCLISLK